MLIYQYSPNWKIFSFWNAVASGIISFAFFPLLSVLKMFTLNNWRYDYFFPFMFAFAMLARAVVLGILAIEDRREIRLLRHFRANFVPHPAMKPCTNSKKKHKK
jgi:hypothetical protein